jgi:hypothetical protein
VESQIDIANCLAIEASLIKSPSISLLEIGITGDPFEIVKAVISPNIVSVINLIQLHGVG